MKHVQLGFLLIGLLLSGTTLQAAEKQATKVDSEKKSVVYVPLVTKKELPESFLQSLEPYKPIYLVNSWFLNGEGGERGYLDQELFLHFSFKRELFWNLYFGYSHKAFWQIYDQKNSRPFREHNYNPELFLEWDDLWQIDHVQLGFEHESNGEKLRYADDASPVNYSRTWNRSYVYAKKSVLPFIHLGLKLWIVTDSDDPEDGSFIVDNYDIQQFMGSGEFYASLGESPSFLSMMLRQGWRKGTETIRLDGRIPLNLLTGGTDNRIDILMQLFSGYGDTLIDYNRKITRFSAGIAFR
ncbi:MAG: hypothetical protein HOE30_19530 [Deltaproteobacteria bacterium]|nr:hypothetical protein [Deltaproteobacteria bacterium]MBT4090685.1 hypothetical protein [Deltaproteobacteria bacterium]MBT4262721.1 hypothetical protein [Deltaproteobacteria bacterium]MBT4640904.1 hypothetical protein [Deltaproteobacteria bacterium]MBT6498766.1 hypothetical protein [Deltaproteobacteria bacterium]